MRALRRGPSDRSAGRTARASRSARAAGAVVVPVKPSSSTAARLLRRLRSVCLSLPEAHEKISHGAPVWQAGKGKLFATFADHHHGAPHVAAWLAAPAGLQEALVEAYPRLYFRPPYVGPSGWVGVVLDQKTDWSSVAALVEQAYRQVAIRRLVAKLPSPEDEAI